MFEFNSFYVAIVLMLLLIAIIIALGFDLEKRKIRDFYFDNLNFDKQRNRIIRLTKSRITQHGLDSDYERKISDLIDGVALEVIYDSLDLNHAIIILESVILYFLKFEKYESFTKNDFGIIMTILKDARG